ncbi:CDP-alcohol phosphatidyltransferase [Microbacterium faecale]|uniref:CDP-alcohol phosphatidyltransferase n=1 Tax=Microbacterium faecale TaxID=1804630 RepID=A0A917DKS0_9MICO|nr:CDP-alcohol phosphatidyltransferase family protein [Microbacterium faecale]GGD45423.1 CDP-alcohol phosphatidyltransferase [Microbacterium faecale]HJB63156.1 CDP-alcohol phosphatidyltransferase family protein [Candidatus Microbacterium pullistercoris]
MTRVTLTRRNRVHELRAELRAAQKSGAGVPAYTRWINRRLARSVAPFAAAWGVTPNAVTFLSAALTVAGIAVLVFVPLSLAVGVAAAILLAAGYVLDSADGQVARLTRSAAPAGEWLDHVVDAFRTPLIHTGVAIAYYLHRPDEVWVMAIALAYALLSSGQFMSQILAEQLSARHGRSMVEASGRVKSLVLLPVDPGTLCWAFALWGTEAFAPLYALLFAANLVHTAASLRRKHRRLV